ncbi:MAG TPA: T9SS C-terminal target domain-containing protein, partial [Flavobacteriales bacterium]|nr:T9SS C-terminal target domain-containing protein [Flavobacteriales bacterium]
MSRTILLLLLSVLTFHMFGQTDVPGCTISVACNFDPAATVNDGSC